MFFRPPGFLDDVGKSQAHKNVVSSHEANINDKEFSHKYNIGDSPGDHNKYRPTVQDRMVKDFPFCTYSSICLKNIYLDLLYLGTWYMQAEQNLKFP